MPVRTATYGLLAVAGLVAGWYYNLQFMQQPGSGWGEWIRLCMANPASASALMDLSFTYLIVDLWMVLEARKIGLRHVWIYILLTVFVSLAFGLGLFLALRERRLRAQEPSAA